MMRGCFVKAVFVFWIFSIMPFLALAQLQAGSYRLAGFACHTGGDSFRTASVPEQAQIDGVWEIEANGSMEVSATQDGCEMTIEGSYSANGSTLTYTIDDVSARGSACSPADGMEGRSQSHEYIMSDGFLYILEPRELAGREEACGDQDIYTVFILWLVDRSLV